MKRLGRCRLGARAVLALATLHATLLVARGARAQAQNPPEAPPREQIDPSAPEQSPPASPSAPASPPATEAPVEVRPGVEPDPNESATAEAPEIVAGPPEALPGWNERRIPILLVPSRDGISIRIRPLQSPDREEQCAGSCVAKLKPGSYEVAVLDQGEDAGSRNLELERPERLVLTPPNGRARTLGLVLGIAGSVLFEAGVVMSVVAYSSSLSDCGGGDCSDVPAWIGPTGLSLGLVGAVTMPIGWVMFGNNLRPRVERTPVDPVTLRPLAKRTSPRVTARIAPTREGVVLGGALVF